MTKSAKQLNKAKDGRVWRRLEGLSAVLEFSNKVKTGISQSAYEEPKELCEGRYSLNGEKQEFYDGSALVVFSGYKSTGYCETCAGESPVGFFYALEPVDGQ